MEIQSQRDISEVIVGVGYTRLANCWQYFRSIGRVCYLLVQVNSNRIQDVSRECWADLHRL